MLSVHYTRLARQPHGSLTPASGPATVETYTVIFNRDGAPERGIVIGRDDEQRRFISNTPTDRGVLESMVKQEMVGAKGSVQRAADGETNIFSPK